jgi:hypothetical protein
LDSKVFKELLLLLKLKYLPFVTYEGSKKEDKDFIALRKNPFMHSFAKKIHL